MMHSLLYLLSLAATVLAEGRTSPPSGCLVVSKTPTSGQYSTVQAAVNALSTSTSPQCIFIYQGTYNEQVHVPAQQAALTIYGYTPDISTYASNTVTITQRRSQDDVPNNDETATLRAWSTNFKVYNINLVNTRGKGSQALALSAQADRQGYYAVQFHGYQDTVLANKGTQIYATCLIVGATDFIFGQRALAWFQKSDIRVLDASGSIGYITAHGRDSASNPSFYVINDCNIAAASGDLVKAGTYYLGRPWRNYARVKVQSTSITDVVNTAGWAVWNEEDPRIDNVYYAEYNNTGDGSKWQRPSWVRRVAEGVDISNILGRDWTSWVDRAYM